MPLQRSDASIHMRRAAANSSAPDRRSRRQTTALDNREDVVRIRGLQTNIARAAQFKGLRTRPVRGKSEQAIQLESLKGYAHMLTDEPQEFFLEEDQDGNPRTRLNITHLMKFSRAIERAKSLIQQAIADISGSNPAVLCPVRQKMMGYFGVTDGSFDARILQKYRQTLAGLSVSGLRIRDLDPTTAANAQGYVGAAALPTQGVGAPTPLQVRLPFIGDINFTSTIVHIAMDRNEDDTVRLLIHEVSHQKAGTGDIRYVSGSNLAAPIAGAIAAGLPPANFIVADYQQGKGVWNADSYAYFALP